MTLLTISTADPSVTGGLDQLAEAALMQITRDTTARQDSVRRNRADFMAADNSSMMGGWT